MKNIPLLLMLLFSTFLFSQEEKPEKQEKLEEVKVSTNKKGIKKSLKMTANTSVVTSKELLKAACCNLAESFETNPSIDVNFSDALTGNQTNQNVGFNESVFDDY